MKPVKSDTKLPVMMRPTRGMSFSDYDDNFTNYLFNPYELLLVLKIEFAFGDVVDDRVRVTFLRENGKVHRCGWNTRDGTLMDVELVQCIRG